MEIFICICLRIKRTEITAFVKRRGKIDEGKFLPKNCKAERKKIEIKCEDKEVSVLSSTIVRKCERFNYAER